MPSGLWGFAPPVTLLFSRWIWLRRLWLRGERGVNSSLWRLRGGALYLNRDVSNSSVGGSAACRAGGILACLGSQASMGINAIGLRLLVCVVGPRRGQAAKRCDESQVGSESVAALSKLLTNNPEFCARLPTCCQSRHVRGKPWLGCETCPSFFMVCPEKIMVCPFFVWFAWKKLKLTRGF